MRGAGPPEIPMPHSPAEAGANDTVAPVDKRPNSMEELCWAARADPVRLSPHRMHIPTRDIVDLPRSKSAGKRRFALKVAGMRRFKQPPAVESNGKSDRGGIKLADFCEFWRVSGYHSIMSILAPQAIQLDERPGSAPQSAEILRFGK